MQYIILSELGSGLYGTVYLVEYENKQYALKRQKILSTEIHKNLSSKIWREVDFSEFTAKHPIHFTRLYKYQIIQNCDHDTKSRNFPPDEIEYGNAILKSNVCIEFLYEKKDDMLFNVIDKLTVLELYSMLIQVMYAISLMYNDGYFHTDISNKNIMFVNTLEKYVTIQNFQIPTFGKIYSLIDYGEILHEKYIMTESEQKKYNESLYETDVCNITVEMFNRKSISNNLKMQKKPVNFGTIIEQIKKEPEHKYLMKYDIRTDFMEYLMFGIFNKKRLCDIIGCDHFIDNLLPVSDMLYMYSNRKKPNKITKYLCDKLKYLILNNTNNIYGLSHEQVVIVS